jgi:hypothetical protein
LTHTAAAAAAAGFLFAGHCRAAQKVT